ncbi:hypothetical protein ABID16_001727 [Rhizobium aquaticum]|uniref:Uncharacterized protein n=1 Tax=Rhizobium aquaticum TaxID=1549636 RepID=A0ABV2IYF7_9HYPH
MLTRTTTRYVHFDQPFSLAGVEGIHAAGDYRLLEDEEQIDGLSWIAYRRIATLIEITRGQKTSLITIDPSNLEDALQNDKASAKLAV